VISERSISTLIGRLTALDINAVYVAHYLHASNMYNSMVIKHIESVSDEWLK